MFKVNYISVEDRQETFNNSLFPQGEIFGFWLAEAGFIYKPNYLLSNEQTLKNDMCQCFRCGLKLHQWDPDIDDPRMQHDKFNPNCVQNFQLLLDTDFNYGYDEPVTPMWIHKKVNIDREIEQLKNSIQDLKEAGLEENSEYV